MPHPASSASYQIHHYPATLIDTRAQGRPGRLTLRPVLPQDEPLLGALVARLSPEARRNRFHGAVKLSPSRLKLMTCVDYRSHLAVVISTFVDGVESLVADARYVVQADGLAAEFALMVDEAWQRQGIGTWALCSLHRAAAQAGVQHLHGDVLEGNAPMLALVQRCGYAISPTGDEAGVLCARLNVESGGEHEDTPTPAPTRRGLQRWWPRHWPGALPAAAWAAACTFTHAQNHPHPETTP